MPLKKCSTCKKNITKKAPGLECSRCNRTVHAEPTCSKLTNKQLNTLRNATSIEWSCEECTQNISRRSSFIIPEEDADDESDSGHIIGSQPTLDTRKLVQDLNREFKKTLREEIRNLETSLEFLSDQINTMENTLKNQDNRIKSLENKNQELSNKNKNLELKLAVLEQGMQKFEQKTLSTSLEIAGLPDVPTQELNKVITTIATKLDVEESDVQTTRRIMANRDKPGLLLMEMKSHSARNKWIAASKEKRITAGAVLPGISKDKADSRIFIREALTKPMKTLLYITKQELRDKFQFVWFKDGNVCARKTNDSKIYYIRSPADIKLIKEQA